MCDIPIYTRHTLGTQNTFTCAFHNQQKASVRQQDEFPARTCKIIYDSKIYRTLFLVWLSVNNKIIAECRFNLNVNRNRLSIRYATKAAFPTFTVKHDKLGDLNYTFPQCTFHCIEF